MVAASSQQPQPSQFDRWLERVRSATLAQPDGPRIVAEFVRASDAMAQLVQRSVGVAQLLELTSLVTRWMLTGSAP